MSDLRPSTPPATAGAVVETTRGDGSTPVVMTTIYGNNFNVTDGDLARGLLAALERQQTQNAMLLELVGRMLDILGTAR